MTAPARQDCAMKPCSNPSEFNLSDYFLAVTLPGGVSSNYLHLFKSKRLKNAGG